MTYWDLTRFAAILALRAAMVVVSSINQSPGARLLRQSGPSEPRSSRFAGHFALSHACWLLTNPLAGRLAASPARTAAGSPTSSRTWRRLRAQPPPVSDDLHPAKGE